MRKWYVFDRYDCFNSFEYAVSAANFAKVLSDDGFEGIHIALMTTVEFNEYCLTGKFPFASVQKEKA